MKPIPKTEKEVLTIYDIWLHSYLNGDVETYNKYLDDNYHFIGSTNNEEFLNRKETTRFFEKTADQLAGKCDLRHETKIIEQFEGLVFVTHLFDAWFLTDNDWAYYGRFRFTNTLRNNKNGWQFIYQHFSTTDSKTEEGETIGFDKVHAENQELREAIKRHTHELEQKNQELKVEGALEKVRSRTMAMQHSEELKEVIQVLYDQFLHLNINIEHAGFILDYKENDNMHIWLADQHAVFPEIILPYFDCAHWNSFKEAKKKGQDFFSNQLDFEEKNKFYKNLFELIPELPEETKSIYFSVDGLAISTVLLDTIGLYIENFSGIPFSDDENALLMRFGKVFQQTYTRFLDLQKAEAQAREAQIETALERVRSRTMAMQNSEELEEVILEVLKKLQGLGISMEQRAAAIFTYEAGNKAYTQWVASPEYTSVLSFNTPYFDHPVQNDIWNARQNGTNFYAKPYPVEVKNSLFKYLFDLPALKNMPQAEKTKALNFKYYSISIAFQKHAALVVVDHSGIPLTEAENSILIRLSKVFNQTYTRFLDLQKAEAQAREAQIEMALEKVRSRTMAMQNSNELQEAAQVLFNEVQNLGIPSWSCGYNILSVNKKSAECWMSSEGAPQKPFILHYEKEKSFIEQYQFFKSKKNFLVQEQKGKDLQATYDYMKTIPTIGEIILDLEASGISLPEYQINHLCKFSKGYLLFITYEKVPNAHQIFKRFTAVFEQTYTRFLDLQKAEAQAREAQIEAALERTRTQSMLMQRSDELRATTQVFHEQLQLLGIDSEFSYLWLPDEEEKNHLFWATWDERHKRKTSYNNKAVTFPLDKNEPSIEACYLAWESGETVHVNAVAPMEVKEYFNTWSELLDGVTKFQPELFPDGLYYIDAYMDYGCFGIMIKRELDEDEKNILGRFSKEFQRTYTRFLDLQKAEEQSREAQIEAALEKVRSRSLAMQKSYELLDVIGIVSEQLHALRLKFDTICFGESNKDGAVKFWLTSKGLPKPILVDVPPIKNKGVQRVVKAQKDGLKFLADVVTGKTYTEWNNHMLTNSQLQYLPEAAKTYLARTSGFARSSFFLKEIALYAMNYQIEPFSDADNAIFNRFAQVFDQSYTRFLDLKKAEAQARESQIEAALEKVRSRTMAMQHSDELPEAANNLFLQVQALGIPAWSAGYCIWEKDQKSALCHMSSEGEVQKAFSLPTIGEGYNFYDPYKKGETFHVSECGGENLVKHYDFMKTLPTVGAILEELEKAGLSLPSFQIFHIVFFKFGYVMFITYETVPDAHHIFKRFGQVFEQTYTRFLDLKLKEDQAVKLEEEKRRLEKTLKDLQETQKQLIQSEKMASLGELTAGIAHEIQNPLNFVNNFSEVSKELLEEMQEEIENGDFEEVKAIMNDVIQNLEKINHHGKRADGIVKGMLQHSRSSTGTKEPTDINALADEYLRLAYHGLRAKDKSFNATLETNFDETLDKINVKPQDMGRVILNLITNAFYASNERKQASKDEAFKPTVSVSTKKLKGTIEISVKDNGKGIPAAIVDKIFQPFFTTKPTGQGTGLGLSMSYDIVTKGHGGALTVETKEGEGTTFKIDLPIHNKVHAYATKKPQI